MEKTYDPERAERDLNFYFKKYGYQKVTPEQVRLLARFWCFLMEANEKGNFTRIHNLEDAAVKHFIDCLIVNDHYNLPTPLLDMGTGPGFPGIPLKILRPDIRIILGEGVQNRVNFLKDAREHLGLKGLDVIGRNIDNKFFYPVKGVITRAVEIMGDTLYHVQNCLPVGGVMIFMKTPDVHDELKDAKKRMGHMFEVVKDVTYDLPKTSHHRRLIVFKKTQASKDLPPIEDEED